MKSCVQRVRFIRSRIPVSLPPFHLQALALYTLFTGCTGFSRTINTDLYHQDYYFSGRTVQIQGEAELPPMERISKSGGEEQKEFLTLRKRREICLDRAEENSHTKWLALTKEDPRDQKEWIRRRKLGVKGRWSSCLDKAERRHYFFDDMNHCRVVMLYHCLPQDY